MGCTQRHLSTHARINSLYRRLSKLLALRLVLDLGVNARRGINSEYAHSVKLRGFADDQDEEYADVDDDVDRFEVCEVNRENGSTTFEVIQTPTT